MRGFHSLQTGKCIARPTPATPTAAGIPTVSIPFKRESVLQAILGFSTPSATIVSIPFKRESVSQVGGKLSLYRTSFFGFPFPSNGKVYSKKQEEEKANARKVTFPFPSNGKVYRKMPRQFTSPLRRTFCFHSLQTGKCIASFPGMHFYCDEYLRFHSLQPGKRIASKDIDVKFRKDKMPFRFPSTGKAYGKSRQTIGSLWVRALKGFDSFQPGKWIASLG